MPIGLVSRNQETLERLVEDLAREGITADFARADIRDAAALERTSGLHRGRCAVDACYGEYAPAFAARIAVT